MLSEADPTRWLEGALSTLKSTIIPTIEDDYVREQAVAAYVLIRHAKNWATSTNLCSDSKDSLAAVAEGGAAAARVVAEACPELVDDERVAAFLQVAGGNGHDPVQPTASAEHADRVVMALWDARPALPHAVFTEARRHWLNAAAQVVANDLAMLGRTAQ